MVGYQLQRNQKKDQFEGTQRSRIWLQLNASEQLKSTLMFEIDNIWGADRPGEYGGSLGTDGINLGLKEAFIDWAVPQTDIRVRMGLQPFILPAIINSDSTPVMWARGAGISVSASVSETLALTGFWMRPFNDNTTLPSGKHAKDTSDLFGILAPIRGDGFWITPWAMYSHTGKDALGFIYRPTLTPAVWSVPQDKTSSYSDGYWAGFASVVNRFAPFRLGLEASYGSIDGLTEELNRSGWYTSGLIEYKFERATPGLMAWYSSGDDGDIANGSERMPTILGNWSGTSMGFIGQFDNRGLDSSVVGIEPTGTWGVSAYLRDIQFFDKLKHLVRVAYYQGTNAKEMGSYLSSNPDRRPIPLSPQSSWRDHNTWGLYATKGDKALEVNLNTTYNIYENLIFSLELGFMNVHRDNDVWTIPGFKQNAQRIAATWRYIF